MRTLRLTLSFVAMAIILIVATPIIVVAGTVDAISTHTRDWHCIRMAESTDNYQADTGNGFYGAYQFNLLTWQALGFSGYPNEAAPSTQNKAALKEYAYGLRTWGNPWHAWPQTAPYCGL